VQAKGSLTVADVERAPGRLAGACYRVLLLVGMPGSGKTALLRELRGATGIPTE